jgi:hypothetical protein
LADLAFAGLSSHLIGKLEGQDFIEVSQTLQRALAHESRARESKSNRHNRPSINAICYDSDSDDDEHDICVAEWNWPAKSKPLSCSALKLISKNQQDDMKFIFNVAKRDRIFDYLLQENAIKLTK